MSLRTILFAIAIVCTVAAGCGGKSATPGGSGGAAAEPTPLGAGAWEGMDHEARKAFMKQQVLPTMSGLFERYTADFAGMDCMTCHGEGATDDSFAMPNPLLPALTADQIAHPDAEHEEITRFMKDTVRPRMAWLLGVPEWTPDAPDGFGCFGCHPAPE